VKAMQPAAAVAPLVLAVLIATACSGVGAVASAPTPSAALPAAPPTAEPPSASPAPTPAPSPTPSPTPNWDERPVAAFEPEGLTQQLITVETAIRDANVTGKQLAWYGHLQQAVYSQLFSSKEWQAQVLAALPEERAALVGKALDAAQDLRSLHAGPAPKTLPEWEIVEPRPIEELLSYYKEAEAEFGVPWYYLASIMFVETRMGRIRGLSVAGAQGPMQFMPATWAYYGKGDVNDPRDAIMGAARYLRASGAPGNMPKALYAYNHSDFYVDAITKYAELMRDDQSLYRGFHGWNVYYFTQDGPVHLPTGWTKEQEE